MDLIAFLFGFVTGGLFLLVLTYLDMRSRVNTLELIREMSDKIEELRKLENLKKLG